MTEVSRGRAEILLVEDSPADVRLFREAFKLHSAQATLDVATDGEEALRRLRREPPFTSTRRPDLVILDLNLPKMDGRDVLATIKGDPELRHIPVVVMTTSDAPSDVNRAYDLHANCYIRKPTDINEFMNAIARCETFWLTVVRLPNR